ncbi:MAG: hypothetical protein ABIM89_13865 [Mycobacteriales bacterium]
MTAVLEARAAAVLEGDQRAFAAGIDPQSPAFGAKQTAVFVNLKPMPLASWSYAVDVPEDEITAEMRARYHADEIYAPVARLRYQFTDFDTHPTELRQLLTFVRRGTKWYLASDSDFDTPRRATARELWDFGPLAVVRTARSLVIGPVGRRAYLQSIARDTDAAVPKVSAIWGSEWSQRVVVLIPTSQEQVSDLIGAGMELSQIAAVAVSRVTGSGGAYRAVGSRVIVNPPNFDQLTPIGQRVVLVHEVTHVATRDATGPDVPAWLVEGFADYVGYRGTAIAVEVAARELAVDVRDDPDGLELPSEVDFHGDNPRLAQAYEGAWMAARMIAERHGEKRLVALYRAIGTTKGVGKDDAVRESLKKVLRTTPERFAADWRSYVVAAFG